VRCSIRPGPVAWSGADRVTFSEAAEEWLRYVEHDHERKPSTVAGYRALVRSQLLPASATCQQDAATYLTAAFTGLRRGELLALRWHDVDFAGQVIRVRASYADGHLTRRKSGMVAAAAREHGVVVPGTAIALREAREGLGDLRRHRHRADLGVAPASDRAQRG
jgi:integrase